MNVLKTRTINLAIDNSKYGLGGPVYARVEPLTIPAPKWVRIYHVKRVGEDHYGQELSSGLWFKIYDWEIRK